MSIKTKGENVYCFDPKYSTYMKMGIIRNGVFYKKVQAKNFMRVVNGYGLQYDAFVDFEKIGIKRICVIEENGNKWLSKPIHWTQNGKVADYGRGKQIFLSLKYMSLKKEIEEGQLNVGQALVNIPEKYRNKIKNLLKKK